MYLASQTITTASAAFVLKSLLQKFSSLPLTPYKRAHDQIATEVCFIALVSCSGLDI